jgi:hypothetical protein
MREETNEVCPSFVSHTTLFLSFLHTCLQCMIFVYCLYWDTVGSA